MINVFCMGDVRCVFNVMGPRLAVGVTVGLEGGVLGMRDGL